MTAGKKLGFVGLGVMGGPMAGHLLERGADLTVFNRTKSKAESLVARGARFAEMPQLAANSDVIITCVGRTEDVWECLQTMAGAKPGSLFIDHSTISPIGAREMHASLKERGHRFVDAPITGGDIGAQKGTLTIFLGGDPPDVEEAIQVVKPYAKKCGAVGKSGSGQMFKMANQIAVSGSLLGLCECMSFAKKAGLDLAQIKELVGGGAGGSWAFDNYGPKVLAEDWTPGFSVKNLRKDLGYCRLAADEVSAAVPGSTLVDSLLERLEKQGHGEWTTAAIYQALLEM